MYRILIFIFIAALGIGGCTTTTKVEKKTTVIYDPKVAHVEADINGDGYVDREEFHQRMVEIFFHGDQDKNGYMSYEEIDQVVVFKEDWRNRVDTNKDGKIALYEFMHARFDDYNEVDIDKDGLLSVDEVISAFEERQ